MPKNLCPNCGSDKTLKVENDEHYSRCLECKFEYAQLLMFDENGKAVLIDLKIPPHVQGYNNAT